MRLSGNPFQPVVVMQSAEAPQQLKTLPMPAEEGLRLGVDQSVLPCEESREKNQRQPCSVGRPPRFDFALEVKGELFPEEHIFRFDRSG